MSKLSDRRPLLDGREIPVYGFGCYNSFGDEITQAVAAAVETGYRYIDSAAKYGNEEAVGAALRQFAGMREELFVLSKVWPTSYDAVEESVETSLKQLGVEYLDAMLLHWPGTDEARRFRAYEALLRLQDKGFIRTVGVSNFLWDQLEEVKRQFGRYPAINQLEIHPAFQQTELQNRCNAQGIVCVAYSPIGRGRYLEDETVLAIGKKYGKTSSQVVLRWHLQRGTVPIPKSGRPERIRENSQVFDFELTPEEMEQINALETGARTGKDPMTFNG